MRPTHETMNQSYRTLHDLYHKCILYDSQKANGS